MEEIRCDEPWVYLHTTHMVLLPYLLLLLSLHIGQSKSVCSRGWFRSTDLWVMGPARFLCATLLISILNNFSFSITRNGWCSTLVNNEWRKSLVPREEQSVKNVAAWMVMRGWWFYKIVNLCAFLLRSFTVSHGELAQTGERSLCMREAPGSIPGFSIMSSSNEYQNLDRKKLLDQQNPWMILV